MKCKREYLIYTETLFFLKWRINEFTVVFIYVMSVQVFFFFFLITHNPLNRKDFHVFTPAFGFLDLDYNIEPKKVESTQMY